MIFGLIKRKSYCGFVNIFCFSMSASGILLSLNCCILSMLKAANDAITQRGKTESIMDIRLLSKRESSQKAQKMHWAI